MKNIAFIYSGDETSLQPLSYSRDAIKSIFSSQDKWEEPINKQLLSLKKFKEDLQVYKDEEINDLHFYFVGHGIYSGPNSTFSMQLIDEQRGVQDIFDAIFDTFSSLPAHVSFVFDACFSGKIIFQTDKWDKGIEIVTSSLGKETSSSISPDGVTTLFTYYFCKAIEDHGKVNLDEISAYINGEVDSQECIYDPIIGRDGKMIIAKCTNNKTLQSLQKNLKQIIPDINVLRLYANNLLSQDFTNIDIVNMEYDEIIKHLYDLRQPLLCLLHNLKHNLLEQDFMALQLEFLTYNINDCCSSEVMENELCNLLITFEPIDDNLERTEIRIWKYQEPYSVDIGDMVVNLESNESLVELVDMIFSKITVSQKNVLLEFILPYELIALDIYNWANTDGQVLIHRFNVVRRIYERMDECLEDIGKMASWQSFWNSYRAKKEEKLLNGVIMPITQENHDDIDFYELEEKPYIRVQHSLEESRELYKKLINESASIIMSPINKDDKLDTLCFEIKDQKLEKLVEASFRKFRKKVPYLLIWDNPNRVIQINPQITGD